MLSDELLNAEDAEGNARRIRGRSISLVLIYFPQLVQIWLERSADFRALAQRFLRFCILLSDKLLIAEEMHAEFAEYTLNLLALKSIDPNSKRFGIYPLSFCFPSRARM